MKEDIGKERKKEDIDMTSLQLKTLLWERKY